MSTKSLQALNDFAIVKMKEEESEQQYGSIIVTDLGENTPMVGEIVDIGPGAINMLGTFISTTLQPGDEVILPKIGPIRLMHGTEEFFLIREKEILAKLK